MLEISHIDSRSTQTVLSKIKNRFLQGSAKQTKPGEKSTMSSRPTTQQQKKIDPMERDTYGVRRKQFSYIFQKKRYKVKGKGGERKRQAHSDRSPASQVDET